MSTYSSPALNGRRGVMLVVHPQLGTVSKPKKYRFGTLPPPPPNYDSVIIIPLSEAKHGGRSLGVI